MTQSPLKIIGSVTSPFVRAVRIACEELGLNYEVEVTTFFTKNTPEQENFIKQHNPLMRVPVLVDGNDTIIDSKVIVTYLIKKYGNGSGFAASLPENPVQENILTIIYGVLDAAIFRFIIKNTQPNINMDEGYAARSLERLYNGLEWLDKQAVFGRNFGVSESLLISALDWMKKRNIVAWDKYGNLVAVHQKFSGRDSLLKTNIPENI